MYHQIISVKALSSGWEKVRKNNGAPGIDGVSVREFGRHAEKNLLEINCKLKQQSYQPKRLKNLSIPKSDGSKRKLLIPSIEDRIIQSSAQIVLAETLDQAMSPGSYGYRPGRGVADAVVASRKFLRTDRPYVLDADIRNYFDSIRHHILMQDLSMLVGDARTLRLVKRWLRQFSYFGVGVAQGSPISPFLANLYLHPLDRLIVASGFRIVRYADDFLVFARDGAEIRQARKEVCRILNSRKLKLHPQKTFLRGPGDRFSFLGEGLKIPSHETDLQKM